MPLKIWSLILLVSFSSCKKRVDKIPQVTNTFFTDFKIVFGSCNKQELPQPFWNDISLIEPNLFIWAGDNIYADTADMKELAQAYQKQLSIPSYQKLIQRTPIMATWDDHDYGKNDAGSEWEMKRQSQQLFLDFLQVPKNDIRRTQDGIYYSKLYTTPKGSINVFVLDTRYHRSSLQKSSLPNKRYEPKLGGTILGKKQWHWLSNGLHKSTADFNIIVSSIQFLSSEHGFETWGNFPNEVQKLKEIIISSKAKRTLILSGDRHISEFSHISLDKLPYPLIDFTSSGLTHSYEEFNNEPNPYRIGGVISVPSYGVLKFNFNQKSVLMEMQAHGHKVLQSHFQKYPQ